MRRLLLGALLALAWPTPARADNAVCNGALVRGQELVKAGKYLEARALYPTCVRAECDSALRAVCANFLSKLTSEMPSLAVSVRAAGGAAEGATVFVDGRRVDASRPVEVDPGEHVVHAERGDGARAELRVSVGVGEQAKATTLTLPSPVPSAAFAEAPRSSPLPAGTFVLGGVALVAAGSFALFGLMGKGTEADLRDACPTGPCDSGAMRRQYLVADVSAVVALLAAGGAVYTGLRGQR